MKGLKCTDQTRVLSMALFTLYFLYGMFKIPLVEYIFSLSLGAVIFGVTHSIEYGVLALLIANLILPMFRSSNEGFAVAVDPKIEEKVTAPAAVAEEEDSDEKVPTVSGVGSTSVTAAGAAQGPQGSQGPQGPQGPPASAPSTFAGSSTPAPAVSKPVTAKKISEKNIPPANQPADLVSDGFENANGGSGLFKLGEIPTDEKGGFHIDAGTSVLNALKSLKPDQISAMTQDTKQLIETQKTLMGMLQSFKPMMSEGKEMMDTFQQMFSSKNGSAMGALKAAQDTLSS